MTAFRPVWAEVDLEAIRHNVRVIGSAVGCPVMAVVKADGYGHGAVPVARAVLGAGATCLAVALVEEAAELRAAGIDAPILLLSEPPADAAQEVVRLDVMATVYTPLFLAALEAVAPACAAVHLKVDTGMHRVGCRPDDALALARAIEASSALRLAGTWTHLAVAEEDDHPATAEQLSAFDAVLTDLAAAGIDPGTVHAANSAGALARPEARRHLVRIGIALYGVRPAPCFTPDPGLRAAMRLAARVSFVKRLPAGTAVSYGLTYRLPVDSTVATIPIGYADGYMRRLSNRAEVVVRGQRVPVAGRITMDQTLLDCGDLPVEPGDEVELFGPAMPAEEVAAHAGTIAYEVVTAVGRRVPRVYRN